MAQTSMTIGENADQPVRQHRDATRMSAGENGEIDWRMTKYQVPQSALRPPPGSRQS